MPEGPEVESARVLVHNNLAGLRITQAIVADDEKVFVNCKDTLQSALEGRKLLEVKRKGKYLWFLLDGEGPIPLIHFGMTGSIIVQGVGSAKYTRINIDTENWPPRFCKLELVFEGGKRMAFVDGRRFGKVKLQNNPLTEARIHPEQPVADMEAAQIKAMHTKMLDIGQISVAANADYTEFPPDWLFHFRWTGKQASSIDGKKIDFITVGSRTSAYVPALQKLVKGSGLSSQKPASKKAAPKARKAAKGESGQDAEEEGGKTAKQQGSKRKASSAATKAAEASRDAEQQDVETAAGEPEEQQKPSGPQRGRGNKRKASTAAAKAEDTSRDAEQQDVETAAGEPEEQQKPSGPQRGRGNKRKGPSSASEAPVDAAAAGAAATDGDAATAEGNGADDKASAGRGRGGKQGNKRARVSAAAASPAVPSSAPKAAAGKGFRGRGGAAAANGTEKGNAGGDAKPEAAGAKTGRQQGKTKAAPAAAAAAAASAGASQKGARPKRGAAAKQK
ncbi:Formamidopyrimidine-DNA glycosylase N-terminal domain-containing protein [Dunaliella salina]|uniref:Formamidopyrimidine-DNA glycosylase N-terminal domain-containing protein n=1 Tax=Dunaliella salina TaxID=3046 RepID=A0ABQ7H6N2_DUNSA|nr:Formamidopyrimidine-DNA glycosylase N-terminal domain-containing protein [Dunaliella salina]|eukprot:KAF5842509.1 Formamidopyrimidine-DNA glycosylase N-terminal domain-containing protein [Dunaliella salina]